MDIERWINFVCMKGVGFLFVSFVGISLVQLPSLYESEVDFKSKAISATGTVVGTREIRQQVSGGGGIAPPTFTTKYISTIKFQTNQRKLVEFTTSRACSSLRNCNNKVVPVLYDPSFPSNARVDSGSTPEGIFKRLLVLYFVFLLVGILLIIVKPSNCHTKPVSRNK